LLYLNDFTYSLLDIKQIEIISFKLPLEKRNRFEGLWIDMQIFMLKDISVITIKLQKRISIDID